MRRLNRLSVVLIVLSLFWTSAAGGTAVQKREAGKKNEGKKQALPAVYKKWLDEEVAYIITATEKEVFRMLQTDRERDLFIEAFWKQRDPTPNTPENEFKTEHYRRISYADYHFGRQAPRPGWKTDQGRFYIILGAPNDIQRFEASSDVYACEIWFYQGKTDVGLPAGFNILFFQEHGHGEFRLYSPSSDGPMALLTGIGGDPTDYLSAYQSLRNKEPVLADVSLSFIPGEESAYFGRPSLSSDMLVQRIEATPQRQVEEKYARKFLQYKDIIEVEYTANYLDSEALVKVFEDPSGIAFIHYALEPRRLSVNQYENKFYTTLKLNGSLALPDGKIIYQYDRVINVNVDEARMRELSHLPFNIHDLIPAVPGEYRLSVLVKNEVSKEFTSLEQTVRVPPDAGAPRISSPLLGYQLINVDAGQRNRLKAFQFGDTAVYCQPNRVFLPKDTLVAAFQVLGLREEDRGKAEVKLSFLKDGQVFKEDVRKASDLARLPDVFEQYPLADFPPYHYGIQVALLVDGAEVAAAKEEFDVTHREAVARPWVHSRILPESGSPMFSQILGLELSNLGRLDEALAYLEKAYNQKRDNPEIVLALARLYMERKEFDKIDPLVEPFLKAEKPADYEMYYLGGRALQKSGRFAGAADVLNKALGHFGVDANLLNALGECHEALGKYDEALAAWRKSLELNADQPEVARNIEDLKRKR